ncbi:Synaptosomal-associated protein 29 [Camponotus japonicus]
MSEDYQHACQRAELLGLSMPSEEEWRQAQAAQNENCGDDDDDGALQDLDYADEKAGHIGGGLDELNSILSSTQKKLNRFKTACGSLRTLLKVKVGSRSGTPHHKPEEPNPDDNQEVQKELEPAADEVMMVETSDDTANVANDPANSGVQPKQIDLDKKMGSHLDKLDSLIMKAENAQYSMQHQTKQMRKFLK